MTNLYNITRFHIADTIHNEFGLPKKDCIEIVSDVIDIIVEGLQKQEALKYTILEHLLLEIKSRIGRNPKTKEEVIIGERKVIAFKASKNVLKYLNLSNAKK